MQLPFDDQRREHGDGVGDDPHAHQEENHGEDAAAGVPGHVDDLAVADRGQGDHGHVNGIDERVLRTADDLEPDDARGHHRHQGHYRGQDPVAKPLKLREILAGPRGTPREPVGVHSSAINGYR